MSSEILSADEGITSNDVSNTEYISIAKKATQKVCAAVTKAEPEQIEVSSSYRVKPSEVLRTRTGEGPAVLHASCPIDVTKWTNLVDQSPTPDVYFRPGYAAAYASNTVTALALVVNTSKRRFLLPLLVREIPVPSSSSAEEYDAITPYGYGGVLPLNRGKITHADVAEMLEQLRYWCIKAGVVSCMLRLHPLLRQHSEFSAGVANCLGGVVRDVGPTAAINLLAWDEGVCGPAGMKHGRRSDLIHARRHLTARIISCESPEASEMLEQFRSIYEETMNRVNAKPFYFFPKIYYKSLQTVLTTDMAVAIAYYHGKPVGAALFLAKSDFGHYHLSGATAKGKQHKAQTMLVVEGAQWMRRRGCRWLHLGGGRAPADPLFHFKHSFGASTFCYSYLALIADQARYDDLVKQRRSKTELATSTRDFFPAYRAPEQ